MPLSVMNVWSWLRKSFAEELVEEVLADLSEVPKPIELLHILNHYVIGQDRAKRALAVAVYNHYKRIKFPRYAWRVRRCGFAEVKHLDDWPNWFWENFLGPDLG